MERQLFRKLSYVWVFCFLSSDASSHDIVSIRAFHTQDGLAHEIVADVVQGSDGSVWLATLGGGISHFDGITWETFDESTGLPSNYVWALHPDGQNGMWAGTREGLAYFDGDTWSPVHPAIPDLPVPWVFCIAERTDGTLWFGTDHGRILEFRRENPRTDSKSEEIDAADAIGVPAGTWALVLDSELTRAFNVQDILQVATGETWCALSELGIAVHDGRHWQFRWGSESVGRKVCSLVQTRDGSVFAAGSGNDPLFRFDGNRWDASPQPFVGSVCVAQSPSGELLVGTREGLWIYREGDWEHPSLGHDIPHPCVNTVTCLEDGTTWVGTEYGAYRIGSMPWLLYERTVDGVPLAGLSLYSDSTTPPLTVDGEGRLVQFTQDHWIPISRLHPDKVAGRAITQAYEKKIWILFPVRAVEFSLEQNRVLRSVLIPAEYGLNNLFQDRTGRLFLLSMTGVYELVAGRWLPRPADPNYIRRNVRNMYEDPQGRLWVEMDDSMECWDGNTIEPFLQLESDLHIRDRISAVHWNRDGETWFGTSGSGLVCWNGESYRRYTVRDGVLNDLVSTIYQASDGTLWAAAKSLGISSYRDGRWVSYTQNDGLRGRAVRAIGEYNGTIWLALQNAGLACYRPTKKAPDTTIREHPQSVAPKARGVFTFYGTDGWKQTPQEDLVYSWQILSRPSGSVEVPWSSFTKKTGATIPLLDPGRYIFQVRAADTDRNIDPTPAQIDFQVLLPVWKSLAFLAPVLILLAIVAIAVVIVHQKHHSLWVSEKKYRDLVSSIDDIIFTLDENAVVTYVSPAIEPVLGYTPSDVVGGSIFEFIHPEDQARAREAFQQILSGESKTSHYHVATKGGDVLWIRTSSRPVFKGDRVIGSHGVLTDITDRKRAEEALQEAHDRLEQRVEERTAEMAAANKELQFEIAERKRVEQQLRFLSSIVEQVSDSILVTDPDFKITYMNLAAEELFGYTMEDLRGREPDLLNAEPNAEESQNEFYQTVSSGRSYVGTRLNKRKDGTTFTCEFRVSPIKDREGR
ncbi:MAG: PAS domain S-box protein, partial [bacterium]